MMMAPNKQRPRKTGLPRALQQELDEHERNYVHDQTPEEFAKEFFGETAREQEGLPPLTWLKDNYKTKSAAIRYLVHLGFPVTAISKHLGVKYQHVRNVATSPLKRGPNEDWRPKSERSPLPLLPPPLKKE